MEDYVINNFNNFKLVQEPIPESNLENELALSSYCDLLNVDSNEVKLVSFTDLVSLAVLQRFTKNKDKNGSYESQALAKIKTLKETRIQQRLDQDYSQFQRLHVEILEGVTLTKLLLYRDQFQRYQEANQEKHNPLIKRNNSLVSVLMNMVDSKLVDYRRDLDIELSKYSELISSKQKSKIRQAILEISHLIDAYSQLNCFERVQECKDRVEELKLHLDYDLNLRTVLADSRKLEQKLKQVSSSIELELEEVTSLSISKLETLFAMLETNQGEVETLCSSFGGGFRDLIEERMNKLKLKDPYALVPAKKMVLIKKVRSYHADLDKITTIKAIRNKKESLKALVRQLEALQDVDFRR